MKEIAIIGPTASGKTALAVDIARECNALILSLDSLAIYKHIDIISAKPTQEEMRGIPHFGIDILEPHEHYSAAHYLDLYRQTRELARQAGKNLVIVGGSSFYLKTIMDGLSPEPEYSAKTLECVAMELRNISQAHTLLCQIDPEGGCLIAPNDRYRIEKALLIYFETGISPTQYWQNNPKITVDHHIKLFEIDLDREVLRERIAQRSQAMLDDGAIDEAAWLECHYTRAPKCMGSIGLKEILDYFDGKIKKEQLASVIAMHTSQFAKRQITFNRHQFEDVVKTDKDFLYHAILAYARA